MRLLFSLLFIVLFSEAFAEPYIIDFGERKIFWYGQDDFYVEKVIVTQDEKDCVGFVKRKKEEVGAYFSHSISDELMLLFGRSFPKNVNARPVTVRINRFAAYEAEALVYFDLNFDVITVTDSAFVIEFSSGFSEQSDKNEMIINSDNIYTKNKELNNGVYSTCILNAFEKSFKEYYERIQNKTLLKTIISNEKEYQLSHYNNLNTRKNIKGLYKTYNDFINNCPDTVYSFIVDKNYEFDFIKAGRIFYSGKKPEYKPWGFSDGKNFYINTNNKHNFFMQLEFDEEDSKFYTHVINLEKKFDALGFIVGQYFGLAGALVYDLMGDIAGERASSNEKTKLKLDKYSGKLLPYDFNENLFDKSVLILAHSDYSSYHALTLKLPDGKSVFIPKNHYYVWTSLPQKNDVKIQTYYQDSLAFDFEVNLHPMELQVYSLEKDMDYKMNAKKYSGSKISSFQKNSINLKQVR